MKTWKKILIWISSILAAAGGIILAFFLNRRKVRVHDYTSEKKQKKSDIEKADERIHQDETELEALEKLREEIRSGK